MYIFSNNFPTEQAAFSGSINTLSPKNPIILSDSTTHFNLNFTYSFSKPSVQKNHIGRESDKKTKWCPFLGYNGSSNPCQEPQYYSYAKTRYGNVFYFGTEGATTCLICYMLCLYLFILFLTTLGSLF